MSQYVIRFKSLQNAFAVSRSLFIADTSARMKAVRHILRMSLNVRRLESNVCCFKSQTCESFSEFRCSIDEGILVSV